jgi:L-rhamnose mutarotase
MKRNLKWAGALAILVVASFLLGAATQKPKPIKRVGMVVGIKPEKTEEYRRLHADSNAGVRDLLNKYHMRNFSIFLQQIEGKWYEFGYYEYAGDDYDGDMAKLAQEPRNIEWLKICDPMQVPLPGDKSWTKMERVYYNP